MVSASSVNRNVSLLLRLPVRLPRHGASCPVGLGVSCSADRQALAKIEDFPAFIVIDDKGNDFYAELMEKKPAAFVRP